MYASRTERLTFSSECLCFGIAATWVLYQGVIFSFPATGHPRLCQIRTALRQHILMVYGTEKSWHIKALANYYLSTAIFIDNHVRPGTWFNAYPKFRYGGRTVDRSCSGCQIFILMFSSALWLLVASPFFTLCLLDSTLYNSGRFRPSETLTSLCPLHLWWWPWLFTAEEITRWGPSISSANGGEEASARR